MAEKKSCITADSPVTVLDGVGRTRAEYYAKLGVYTLGDLIAHYPRAYEKGKVITGVDAADALDEAVRDLELGVPLDLCCVTIESALSSLGEVDGRELGEEIVAEIFSRFCVGK